MERLCMVFRISTEPIRYSNMQDIMSNSEFRMSPNIKNVKILGIIVAPKKVCHKKGWIICLEEQGYKFNCPYPISKLYSTLCLVDNFKMP
jgi:hypothetical protein